MRLDREEKSVDHDDFTGQTADDHHPQGESFRILINLQSIGATSAYEFRQSIKGGHKTIRAILRGLQSTDVQGHVGAFVMGNDNSGECTGVSVTPYGSGYPTTYMGCYSRIHGDSYLTHSIFGGAVRLRDIYIDTATDEAVLEFYNAGGLTTFFSCYGLIEVK